MRFKTKIYLFKIATVILLLSTFISAQESTISGFILDETDGESLIGANVYLAEDLIGSITNEQGYYVITDVPAGRHTIICSYIGYKDFNKEIEIANFEDLELNVFLAPELIETETIIVSADSVRTSVKLFRKGISNIHINPMEIRQMPAVAEADLLRSLQNLPGILPISDYSSNLYIRGGTSDQNLFLLDGADVYNPQHAFGLFSTFNTDAIKDVSVSKGGFGANFGGRLSSVLNITKLDGNRKKFEGTAEISLLSAKTTLQTPLWNIGSISASIRRTYFDQTVAPFIDDIPDYYFYDGHVKANFDINSHNKLSLSFFNGRDDLKYSFNSDAEDSPTINYDWGNTTGSARWTWVITPRLFSNFYLTTSVFNSNLDIEEVNEKNDLTDVSLKGQLEYALSQEIHTNFGFEYKDIETIYQQDTPGGIIDIERKSQHFSGYGLVIWEPDPRWFIEAGARLNQFKSDKVFLDWAPRFLAKYRLTETINLKAAAGVYYQYLNKIPRPFVADIWTTADKFYDRSRAEHIILGFQKEVANNLELEVEAYFKTYKNLYSLKYYFVDLEPESFDANGRPTYSKTDGLFNRGDGDSRGIELLLRKKLGAVSGWVAYSLSETRYLVDNINQNNDFVPRHDRSHVINTVLNVDIGDFWNGLTNHVPDRVTSRWLFGLNFIYSSGQPITLTSSTYFTNSIPDREYEKIFLYPTTINGFRLPAYSRMDLSLTYEKYYETWTLAPYVQVFNLGNRENVWFIQYENKEKEDKIVQDVTTFDMFPLLPTIGVRFKF